MPYISQVIYVLRLYSVETSVSYAEDLREELTSLPGPFSFAQWKGIKQVEAVICP